MAKSTKTPTEKFFSDSIKWAKFRAKKDGRGFDLSITPSFLEGMFKGQNGLCALTGQQMELVRGGDWYGGKNPMVCSIDRMNPELGYTLDNIQLTCTKWNTLKGEMTNKQWFAMCEAGATLQAMQLLTKQGWQG
jgi:hypothetical protein